MKISAIVLTKNEGKNMEKCLKSIQWCDEIILIDDQSSDNTASISKSYGATIFKHTLNDNFAAARNFGLSKAKGDWVLFVDADERISDALAFEMSNIVHQVTNQKLSRYNGFYIKRIDYMWGKKLKFGETGKIMLLRLARKNAGKWEGKVHEKWKIKDNLSNLKNPILHFPHQTLKEFLKEINLYSTIKANELYSKNIVVHWWSIILYPFGKFIINYFFKKGFLDGVHGLVFAITMSFHSFLVRGKLWLMSNKNEN